jgi:hypothetical protein
MWKFLGKGWKTVTGALIFGVGLVMSLAPVGIIPPEVIKIAQTIGAALAALGIAHKAERLDSTTPTPEKVAAAGCQCDKVAINMTVTRGSMDKSIKPSGKGKKKGGKKPPAKQMPVPSNKQRMVPTTMRSFT